MAVGDVNPGYMGYAEVAGLTSKVRFTDASINARQDINAPDLVMGHWDHNAYVFQKIEIGGTISGPVTENFALSTGSVWEWAVKRSGTCGTLTPHDVGLFYYCSTGTGTSNKLFPNMRVNSLTFSCAAGDIAQFSLDVLGAETPTWGGAGSWSADTDEEKLMTWDQCAVSVTAGDEEVGDLGTSAFSNFTFTINNNIQTIYAIGAGTALNNLYPFDLVPGMRGITGSLSVYNVPQVDGAEKWTDYAANQMGSVTFSIGATTFTMKVRFHRVEAASSVGPIISTVAFTGVGWQQSLDA